MRRLTPHLVLCLIALMLASSAGPAIADEADSAATRTLDRRVRTAERRIRLWNHRLQRWHTRIGELALVIDRLTVRAAGSEPISLEDAGHGFPMRELATHRLERAHDLLGVVLRDPRARRAQLELEAWSVRLVERQRARDRSVRDAALVVTDPVAADPTGDRHGPPTYESWATAFLAHVSAPVCSDNLAVVVTWETSESTDAAFNPLATTRDMDEATDFNSVGVKNYRSWQQGLDASRDTLQGGADSYGYVAILQSLQACAPAEVTAAAINASAWCRGCTDGAYLTGLLPIVRADYASHAERLVSTGT